MRPMLLGIATLVATSSAMQPPARMWHRHATIAQRSQPQMGLSLSTVSSSITTILYAVLGATATSGLVDKVPKLMAGDITAGVQVGDVAVDAALFCVAAVQLGKIVGIIGGVDFDSLEGLPKSFAYEAGQRATAGEVSGLSKDDRYEVCTFAGGCFWGTELYFQRIPGVVATCVGYTQGGVERPTYEQVCGGMTGHTEATQLIYDPTVVSYELLCETLFQTVYPDATALNRKGNDRGTQYRHGIYTHTAAQADAAVLVREREQQRYGDVPIVTEIKPAMIFWPAEGYHQRYLEKGGQSAAKNARERVRCYG